MILANIPIKLRLKFQCLPHFKLKLFLYRSFSLTAYAKMDFFFSLFSVKFMAVQFLFFLLLLYYPLQKEEENFFSVLLL